MCYPQYHSYLQPCQHVPVPPSVQLLYTQLILFIGGWRVDVVMFR